LLFVQVEHEDTVADSHPPTRAIPESREATAKPMTLDGAEDPEVY